MADVRWQADLFIDDCLSVALYSDALVSSHPISVPVRDPAEIGEIFDAISYEKVRWSLPLLLEGRS